MKYSDLIAITLKELGFTHFFFVGGGNIMHLTGSLAKHLIPIPVIHEVAAVIASEYFNKVASTKRSIALVTAGPGITNAVTGISGAFLESRPVLILGGQVKTGDLKASTMRQRGIQEIDGQAICRPITKFSLRLDMPISQNKLREVFRLPFEDRNGPVFLEIPLDVQASQELDPEKSPLMGAPVKKSSDKNNISLIASKINASRRPVILLGGGTSRDTANQLADMCENFKIPIATTWNAADLIPHDHPTYVGRPNTWGQRSSNIILQQSDFLIAIGTRLGLQQTGFNWTQFVPLGEVAMVDIDKTELTKGHPKINYAINADAGEFTNEFIYQINGDWSDWMSFAKKTREMLPLNEASNNFVPPSGYIQPYSFVEWLSENADHDSIIVPCSSGSAFTCMMQTFKQKKGQRIVTNKGLASMGYGLSGAIGAALGSAGRRVYLVEGDGGFSQNIQELGTVGINKLNLKIFIFDDLGHASIRMTQKNYFKGNYVGCDTSTNLGLPNWEDIGSPWGITTTTIQDLSDFENPTNKEHLNSNKPVIFIIKIHPDQTYLPKITSSIKDDGGMVSNPLHMMTPELDKEVNDIVLKYLSK